MGEQGGAGFRHRLHVGAWQGGARTGRRLFHTQQCVEKYLKGFLVLHHVTFSKTHDLEHLLSLALTKDPLMEALRQDVALLKPYSVEIRYPGEEATPAETRAAVKRMKRVRAFLRKKLGLKADRRWLKAQR